MTQSLAASVSLLHGWLPLAVQVIGAAILVFAVGWRPRRWNLLWLPIAVAVGVGAAWFAHWYIGFQGWSDHPAPWGFWVWIALTAIGVVVLVAGWRGIRMRQRVLSVLAVPVSLLCVALALNQWVGYVSTTAGVWHLVTGAPLGGQIDAKTFQQMREQGEKPVKGTVLSVKIPDDASGFKHRDELVYLPPAWYASKQPPALPVVMMVGGEFGRPDDWPRVGAVKVLDDFAAEHDGNAPVVVWVDQSGAFANDPECVNGVRGNSADHLTKDVIPYMISNFAVSTKAANWGIAGWSSGGTCALTLTTKYPELFSAFVDIDGQAGPNAGTQQQTLHRLFGGDADAMAAFDPKTVMAKHGAYQDVSAWFGVSEETPNTYHAAFSGQVDPAQPTPTSTDGSAAVAQYMCALASSYGIECSVVSQPGKHDFVNAMHIFESALPWLAGRLGTPGVPVLPLPGAPSS